MKLSDVAKVSGVVFGTSGVRGLVSAMTPDVCFAHTQAFLKSIAINAEVVV